MHAQVDGLVVEQFEFRVQLQHRPTSSWTHLVGRLTVEPIPNSPVGVSPFLFCPTDGLAAVEYLDTSPAIAQPSTTRTHLLSLGTPKETLTFWYVCVCVCMCMCMCVCVCNILLIVFYGTPPYLQSRIPPSSLSHLSPSYKPNPMTPLLYANN